MTPSGKRLLLTFVLILSPHLASPASVDSGGEVELSVVPTTGFVERHEFTRVVVSVANHGTAPVRLEGISLYAADFHVTHRAPLPRELPSGGQRTVTIRITAGDKTAYGKQSLVARLRVATLDVKPRRSAVTATFDLEVRRPWSEEASGLPGGNPALFFLLLPVVPAFLAYQLVDRRRRGEGWAVPKIDGESVAAAFFLALLVNLGRTASGWAESDPSALGTIALFLVSAVLGAAWPALRWWKEHHDWEKWAFRIDETPESYLKKALLGPRSPEEFLWTRAKVEESEWEGILLEQPDGTRVLGASLQLCAGQTKRQSLAENPIEELRRSSTEIQVNQLTQNSSEKRRRAREQLIDALEKLVKEVTQNSSEKRRRAREQLISALDAGEIEVCGIYRAIRRKGAANDLDARVVISQVAGLLRCEQEPMVIVKRVG